MGASASTGSERARRASKEASDIARQSSKRTASPTGKIARQIYFMPYASRMLKIYAYAGCSTCRNALKWLKSHSISFQEIPIRETPPSIAELKRMLAARDNDLRALFNTSGMDYRAQGLKEKLPAMAADQALKMLSENGNLVKRPLAIDSAGGVCLNGFKEPEWKAAFKE
jgi:arsenate reductase